ncbi:MAG: LacI family DNA-binding transcriptional regulator [Paenibacillus macerans]|uniref:Helix-turn-helix family protein n=1 Tax=Paenibacillus macerans TaxID=44252 RepID=A0A091A821_PAEMA|nr:LacI family DNA-binding transcriptional regulator [Paenibacillus macerans]KFN12376.1 helix-turn-helix family protein [Paenibacillus macerans]MBS5914692.1 LacI family DNA-binding transcriptional regulator [Paenibacillus macerans]MCY7558752.1 LacI family DNA-binding transcriptional regulator [Paenibacillus macerans]MDU7477158.1 LacI family DNA-binding transcriptional regulator [Paenibacillus macerans]MEC0140396.1 LacI family DNA-binding transcriptional regulator [Paenibacillus macerans]
MKTIADIAKLAGVAKSTVSRYLNGGPISEATKKKIEQVIHHTGYVPNTFAQSLKAKKTNIIGTVVPRLDSFASSQVLIGIDEQLRALNYQMLIANTNQDLEREIESIYSLSNQKVAGIILLATQITDAHLEAFDKMNIPVILVGQQHDQVYSVIHNDESAGYEIGKYVLRNGHRKIAYLGVSEKDIAVGLKRKEGFKRAVSEAGNCEVKYYETSFKMEEAVKKAGGIIDAFHPSILVCATDNIALGALKAAHLKGIRVPEDLSITGFGGYEVTEITHPGLTTIKFYYKDAGRDAAGGMIKLVNGEDFPPVTLSKFEMIERESVDNKSKRE